MVIISELGNLLTQQPVPHQMSTHGFDSTSLSLKRPRQCVAGLGWLLDPCFTPNSNGRLIEPETLETGGKGRYVYTEANG